MSKQLTAAVLLIGNELLSGSVQDCNLQYIAKTLETQGIRVMESRTVLDIQAEIVDALNILRSRYDYVFTTGGIGPTHDDITSEAVAAAFNVELTIHSKLDKQLGDYLSNKGVEYNKETRKMAHTPQGAELIQSSHSIIPCYRIDNVFVLAGIPSIMQFMLDDCLSHLPSNAPVLSKEVHANVREGQIAAALTEIQAQYPRVDIGSYPQEANSSRSDYQVVFVVRSSDEKLIDQVCQQIHQACEKDGYAAIVVGNSTS